MNDSDSELEFESADEGAEDVSDIDLSDLEETTTNKNLDLNKDKNDNTEKECNQINENETETEVIIPEKSFTNKNSLQDKIKEDISEEKPKKIDSEKTSKDENKSSLTMENVEGDDDIEKMLNEMGISDLEIEKKSEISKDILNQDKIGLPESKNIPENEKPVSSSSGWDDDDLKLDEDDLIEQNLPVSEPKSNIPEVKNQKQPQEQQQQPKQSGWSWSSFGTNLISTAVGSLNTVLETVEATIGAPDPAELAAKSKLYENEAKSLINQNQDKRQETEKNDWINDHDESEWFSMPQLDKLTTTSLNILETVGKKTIEAISDKDPNFKNTRSFLSKVPSTLVPIQAKPNLSQMLREAQQNQSSQVETPNKTVESVVRTEKQEKLTFSLFFDEYKGSAHLEALEMLSRETSVKVEMFLLDKSLVSSNKASLDTLNHLFDSDRLNDDDETDDITSNFDTFNDFKLLTNNKSKCFDTDHYEFLINDYAKKSSLKLILDKVVGAFKTTSYAFREIISLEELYNESIKCFALITSNLIELYHKAAESMLIEQQNPKKTQNPSKISHSSPLEKAEVLFNITKLCIRSITILADDFSKKCKTISKENMNTAMNANQVITDIYLEASNSSTYIGDAYLLFLPIFKSQVLEKQV